MGTLTTSALTALSTLAASWTETIAKYSTSTDRDRGKALHRFLLGVSRPEVVERIRQMTEGRKIDLDSSFFVALADSVRRAIYTSSALYLTEPIRQWTLNGEVLETASTEMTWIEGLLKQLNWHSVVRQAELLANLHASVVVMPVYDSIRNRVQLRLIPRYGIEAVPDSTSPEDLDVAQAVLLYGSTAITAWHGSRISYLDAGGFPLTTTPPGPTTNPYGDWYPFVLMRLQEPIGYPFPAIPDALYETHLTVNAAIADILATVQFQAFGQPWVNGVAPNELPTAVGARTIIGLTNPAARFEFASPQPMFSAALETVRKIARLCAGMSNLSPTLWEDVAVERTGDAIMASRADIEIERQRQVRIWSDFEPRLWAAVVRVIQTYAPVLGWTVPDGLDLRAVFYQPPEYPALNPQARAQADQIDLATRVTTLEEVLMRRHGYDEQTAAAEAAEREIDTNSGAAESAELVAAEPATITGESTQ